MLKYGLQCSYHESPWFKTKVEKNESVFLFLKRGVYKQWSFTVMSDAHIWQGYIPKSTLSKLWTADQECPDAGEEDHNNAECEQGVPK